MTVLKPPEHTGTQLVWQHNYGKHKAFLEQMRERKIWVSPTKQEPPQAYFIYLNIKQFAKNNDGSSTEGNHGKDSLSNSGS